MIYPFGWLAIACAFLLTSFLPMAWQTWRTQPLRALWGDIYFWLLLGISMSAIGVGEVCVMRVFQQLTGTERVAQPVTLAVFATLTAGIGALCKMRALAINAPRRGRLFLYLCAAWAVFAAMWELS